MKWRYSLQLDSKNTNIALYTANCNRCSTTADVLSVTVNCLSTGICQSKQPPRRKPMKTPWSVPGEISALWRQDAGGGPRGCGRRSTDNVISSLIAVIRCRRPVSRVCTHFDDNHVAVVAVAAAAAAHYRGCDACNVLCSRAGSRRPADIANSLPRRHSSAVRRSWWIRWRHCCRWQTSHWIPETLSWKLW